MLPTLHHGVSINPSRLDYQQIDNRSNNLNVQTLDQSESRLNKSRLLDYGTGGNGGGATSNYSSEHVQQQSNKPNKYGSENYSHLPHIRQNDWDLLGRRNDIPLQQLPSTDTHGTLKLSQENRHHHYHLISLLLLLLSFCLKKTFL